MWTIWLIKQGTQCMWDSVSAFVAGRSDTQQWQCSGLFWQVRVPVAEPMHILHPCHHGHCVHEPIGSWQGCLETGCYLLGPIPLIMKILLCWGHHLVSVQHETHISSHFLPIQIGLSTSFFPKCPWHRFSNRIFSKCLTISEIISHGLWMSI